MQISIVSPVYKSPKILPELVSRLQLSLSTYDLYFNKIYSAQNFNRKPGYIIYGISVDVSGSINIKKILD